MDDLAGPRVDDFGNVLDRHFLIRLSEPDLQDLLAQGGELAGHAGAELELDLLREVLRDGALGADVAGDGLAAEGDGDIGTHDAALVDGDGRDARADVHERDAALAVFLREDGLRDHVRQEVLLRDGDAHRIEDLVHGGGGPAAADEHLEIALQFLGEGAHHVAFHELDLVVDGEGLGHGAVHDLAGLVVQRVGLEGHRLQVLDFLLGDVLVGVGPDDAARGRLLPHVAAGHAHDHLQDLDHEFVLGLLDGLLQGEGRLHRVGDHAAPDAGGRGLLVIDDLDVIPLHAGDAEPEFGGSQVNGCNVTFFHIV